MKVKDLYNLSDKMLGYINLAEKYNIEIFKVLSKPNDIYINYKKNNSIIIKKFNGEDSFEDEYSIYLSDGFENVVEDFCKDFNDLIVEYYNITNKKEEVKKYIMGNIKISKYK